MNGRLARPDTLADLELKSVLDAKTPQNFIVIAGAGSGKTTSLIKALEYVISSRREQLTVEGRRVACITYTDIAAEEITKDVGSVDLVHVSTIHSFLWSVVHPFTVDISHWVEVSLLQDIKEKEGKLSSPRTRQATRVAVESEIIRLNEHLEALKDVRRWTYGTGSNYKKGVLGHSDIIKMVPALIIEKPLLAKIIAQRFPFIFVDESQDTDPVFVDALKHIAKSFPESFCLGFFGDPMQQIYSTGVGQIELEPSWKKIEKPQNYRCSSHVINVLNAIRKSADGLVQTAGKSDQSSGSVHVYVIPADEKRGERVDRLCKHIATETNDSEWLSVDGVRVLVIVHRMAAKRLGFEALYEAANDGAPASFKQAFSEGELWILRSLKDRILPLVTAHIAGRSSEVMSRLRKCSPLLTGGSLAEVDIKKILSNLKEAIEYLARLVAPDSHALISDVLAFAASSGITPLDERLLGFFNVHQPKHVIDEDESEESAEATIAKILACRASEVSAYQKYIEGESLYSTQHGVKGAEFKRVMVVLDDDEGKYGLYSYDKFFGLKDLSETDNVNILEKTDSVLDRTRRLFYVCCSRAEEDLVVIFFSSEPDRAIDAIRKSNIFSNDQVKLFDSL